mgnify:FL=1
MNKNTYIILPIEKLDYINFNLVIEKKKTLRYNINNTEFIVKFFGDTPTDLKEYKKYTHSEILDVINNPENGWLKIEI